MRRHALCGAGAQHNKTAQSKLCTAMADAIQTGSAHADGHKLPMTKTGTPQKNRLMRHIGSTECSSVVRETGTPIRRADVRIHLCHPLRAYSPAIFMQLAAPVRDGCYHYTPRPGNRAQADISSAEILSNKQPGGEKFRLLADRILLYRQLRRMSSLVCQRSAFLSYWV